MQELLNGLRKNSPSDIAGFGVERITDYQNDKTGLPFSDVIRFFLENHAEAVVRPSGTEPKLKVYLTACSESKEKSLVVIKQLTDYFRNWVGT